MTIKSFDVTCEKKKLKKYEPKSPYLTGDRVQLLSQVTEKRSVKKKTSDYVSSFPLAANIYKANSDEFKSVKRADKKIKKSVLTLPNQASPAPQICTVSDMNDSEYYSQSNGNNNKPRLKKRSGVKNVRKLRLKNKELEFYDRDVRYCSQFDVNLDSSSTEMMKPYKGDGRRGHVLQKGSKSTCPPKQNEDQAKPHDVWAVLRNLNRFPFQASPPMSEESIIGTKKKKAPKKRINSIDTRVFETKEFAYISSYEVDNHTHSLSQSSSFDRVTVIDKQDEFSKICKQFEDRFLKQHILKDSNDNKNRQDVKKKSKKRFNKRIKAVGPPVLKENNTELVPLNQNGFNMSAQHELEYNKNNSSSIDIEINSSLTNIDNSTYIKQNVIDYSLVPAEESFIHSDNSGSSKAELSATENFRTNRLPGKSGRAPQLKGISRMNFSKTCEPVSQMSIGQPNIQKRKPRLVTTMPSACMMPKLTQADIKRRIAALRFPIIIAGKDQVNSSVEVYDYDPPQFHGLDKHIWPYMVKWHENDQLESEEMRNKQDIALTDYCGKLNRRHDVTKCSNELFTNKVSNCKSKHGNTDLSSKKYMNELKTTHNTDINSKRGPTKNQKSITQLKDKMLNFLFKKIPKANVVSDDYKNNYINPFIDIEPVAHMEQPLIRRAVQTSDACTETHTEMQIKSISKPRDSVSPRNINRARKSPVLAPQLKDRVQSPRPITQQKRFEYPWAKAKRANDFIESVIKKMKTGVYYTQEHDRNSLKNGNRSLKDTRATDIAMQTELSTDYEVLDNILPKVTIVKKHSYIPGFETSLPGLEIKTLNINQIAVKHCVTNIMMQFDVTSPTDNNKIAIHSKTLPLMPAVEVTESHTKIFKCKTSIVNAMLPAELCSILPKLIRVIDTDVKSLRTGFCSGLINKTQTHLSPISELSIRATNTSAAVITTKSLKTNVSPFDHLSAAVHTYIIGMFSQTHEIQKRTTKINPIINYNSSLLLDTLPKLSIIDVLTYRIRVLHLNEYKSSIAIQSEKACTALEVYTMQNKRLVPAFRPYNFERTITEILIKTQVARLICIISIPKIQYDDLILYGGSNLPYDAELATNVAVVTNNLNMNGPPSHGKSNRSLTVHKDSSITSIECIKHSNKHNSDIKGQHSVTDIKFVNNKNKRIGYYKLYRKCKSATAISTVEKCASAPLNKIKNMDDFFQVLGSKRILASVFDGIAEKKILSSIVEMRNWITNINPKQALLLLLLMNKKDTPNLVRFRPILLQGIAVNRITRATELDMEIEVIERENFHKIREYEGISYLPASVENHDQLLEELYWIAKTTASDYQKPFDESSEKLLKSLLEKRKKLNPSYLRVMARYVGLGLLRQPTKK